MVIAHFLCAGQLDSAAAFLPAASTRVFSSGFSFPQLTTAVPAPFVSWVETVAILLNFGVRGEVVVLGSRARLYFKNALFSVSLGGPEALPTFFRRNLYFFCLCCTTKELSFLFFLFFPTFSCYGRGEGA